jgi:O-antigen/teichoic acid export membrane protein
MYLKSLLAALFAQPFLRQSLVYLSGNVVNAALPLMMMPILTRYLYPEDYGIVGTATVLVQFLVVAVGLNASGLIVGSEFLDDSEAQRRLVSTNMLVSAGIAIFLVAVALLGGGVVEQLTKLPSAWAPAVVFLAAAGVVQSTYMALLQARNKAATFITLQVLATVSNLGFSLFLVMGGMGWRGRILGMVISVGLVSTVSLHGLVRRLKVVGPVVDRASARTLLSFGVPLIPHFIGGWIMTLAPRLYLNHLATIADTGLYSVGVALASGIALIVGAANQAYMPELFRRLSRPEGHDRLRLARILLVAAVALPLASAVYALAAWWLLPVIVGPRFYAASPFVAWLALAFAMQGVYFIFGNFVVYSKRTSLMAWRADFLGGLVMLASTPFLIWLSGPIGAAQATCLGFAVSCAGCISASRKAYPMPWAAAAVSLVRGTDVAGLAVAAHRSK